MLVPAYAKAPCRLSTAPEGRPLTVKDLEILSAVRGEQIVTCDEKRDLAVLAGDEQQKALDKWEAERVRRRCPWWRRLWGCKVGE